MMFLMVLMLREWFLSFVLFLCLSFLFFFFLLFLLFFLFFSLLFLGFNDKSIEIFCFFTVEVRDIASFCLVNIGARFSWWTSQLRVCFIIIIVGLAPEVSLFNFRFNVWGLWLSFWDLINFILLLTWYYSPFENANSRLSRWLILSIIFLGLILISLWFCAHITLFVLQPIFFCFFKCLWNDIVVLLELGSNISCFLFCFGMMLNFLFKLSLYFMQFLLSVFGFDFSYCFLIDSPFSDLLGNFLLDPLIFIVLFTLFWRQLVWNRLLKWMGIVIFCKSLFNFFFDWFFNCLLDVVLQISVVIDIWKWLDCLIDDIRINWGLYFFISFDNIFCSFNIIILSWFLWITLFDFRLKCFFRNLIRFLFLTFFIWILIRLLLLDLILNFP